MRPLPQLTVLGVALVSAFALNEARTYGQVPNDLPNPYKVESFGQLPAGRKIGAAYGIDIDRDGKSVWVFERCGGSTCAGSNVAPLLKFDSSGRLVASFGAGMFVFPHGLFVDADDNIWVTDGQAKDGKGNQVVEFSPTGRVMMTLGQAGETGSGPDTFNQPSDVLVTSNAIFVADGHGGDTNARIVKFDRNGKYIKEWGRKGSGPGEFDTPHGLVLDGQGRLLVADRGNSRIQAFDQEGRFIAQWKQFGRPSGISLDKSGMIYAADSQSGTPEINPGIKQGVRIGGEREAKARFFLPDPPPAGSKEGIAVDRDGIVYLSRTADGGLFRWSRGGTTSTR